MRPRLVLFDIDGTILSAHDISAACFGEALDQVFGTRGDMAAYDYSGKTDPQIVRELMRGAGIQDVEIDRRLADVLALYAERLTAALRPEHIRAKPGIGALLDALAAEPAATLGLLTGNLEPCARVKLGPLDANRYFAFGAFGSDDEDRYRLPAVALARGRRQAGRAFAGSDLVIVGDSIHDVLCGRSLGARAVAVATGITPLAVLADAGAAVTLRDFSDTAAALAAILD